MSFFQCDCNKKHKKVKQDGEDDDNETKKKWKQNDVKYYLETEVGVLKYTDDEEFRYIINSSYIKELSDYSKGKRKEYPYLIRNSDLLNLNDNYKLKTNISLKSITIVINEVMRNILKYSYIDYIVRIPMSKKDKVIRLSESKIFKEKDYLSSKPKSNNSKWSSADNCEFALLQLSEEYNTDLKLISSSIKDNKENESQKVSITITPKKLKENQFNEQVNDQRNNKQMNVNVNGNGIVYNNDNSISKLSSVSRPLLIDKNISSNNLKSEHDNKTEKTDKKSDDLFFKITSPKKKTKSINNISSISLMKCDTKILIKLDYIEKTTLYGIGLDNPSVYCFMNTCLQCLISIPEFNTYFLKKNYKNEKMSKKSMSLDACEAMTEFINCYSNCSRSSMIAPKSLYSICHSLLPRNQQHDSHEFLIKLLSKLQEEINPGKKYTIPDDANYQKAWDIYRDSNPSTLDAIFTGLMKSAVICNKCNHQSDTFDPFMDISLSIIRRKLKLTLSAFFEDNFSDEEIDCEYKCEKCKKKTSITKKTEIVLSPPILTLHFLRFAESRQKYNGQILFEEYIDLTDYCSKEIHPTLKYELIATAVHLGSSAASGHYVAYTKREGSWYYFNDGNISKVSSSDALCKDVYFLMYRRIDA